MVLFIHVELICGTIIFEGKGDQTKCFWCGGILADWEPGDEPVSEHRKWFKHCKWLEVIKSEPFFIKAVCIEIVCKAVLFSSTFILFSPIGNWITYVFTMQVNLKQAKICIRSDIKFYLCHKTFCIIYDKQCSYFYKHLYNIYSMNKIMLKFELCLQTKLYQEEFKNII